MTHDAQQLEKELAALPYVHRVEFGWASPAELTVGVVLEPEWNTRSQVIELVDDFARRYIDSLTVALEMVESIRRRL